MPLGPTCRAMVLALLLAGLAVLAPHPAQPAAEAAERNRRPNVIVIFTDDMREDEMRQMPAVERLAGRGVRFTNAVSANPLCCPARASLLTGKLAHNHRTMGNTYPTFGGDRWFKEHNPPRERMNRWMQNAGYRTGWIGKYLNQTNRTAFRPPDWNYFAAPIRGVYNYRRNVFSINGTKRHRSSYREEYTRELLMRRVKRWGPARKPYLLFYSALAPHSGTTRGDWHPAEPGEGFGDDEPRHPLTAGAGVDDDLADKPTWLRANGAGREPHYARVNALQRVRSLMSVNRTVNRLERYLRRHRGQRRNTVVVFTSDNGMHLGEHRLRTKSKAYREALQVPLVVAGPGFGNGETNEQMVGLHDITRTAMRAARIRRRHGTDGVPLQRVAARPGAFARRAIVVEGVADRDVPKPFRDQHDRLGRFYRGVVWKQLSVTHYADGPRGFRGGSREFYDRGKDPDELTNRWGDPEVAEDQAMLDQWFRKHHRCAGAECNEPLPH